jgi:single-strand DNA-binding protein
MNKIFLIGNLGRDPELRVTPTGVQVCTFTLATGERRKDPTTSQWVDHTEWHNVICFGKAAELCSKYLKKGSQVFVEGRLQTRKWVDQSGVQRQTTEVVASNVRFLSRASATEPSFSEDDEILKSLQTAESLEPLTDEEEIPF